MKKPMKLLCTIQIILVEYLRSYKIWAELQIKVGRFNKGLTHNDEVGSSNFSDVNFISV